MPGKGRCPIGEGFFFSHVCKCSTFLYMHTRQTTFQLHDIGKYVPSNFRISSV